MWEEEERDPADMEAEMEEEFRNRAYQELFGDEDEQSAPQAPGVKAAGKRPMMEPPLAEAQRKQPRRGEAPTPIPTPIPVPTPRHRDDDEETQTHEEEAVIDSSDDEEEEEEDVASRSGSGNDDDGGSQPAGDDDDDGARGGGSVGGNSEEEKKLYGYKDLIMGKGVRSLPAAFETGVKEAWIQWTPNGRPFREGEGFVSARDLCICIDKRFFSSDAERIGEWETHSDQVTSARAVASAALMGLFTIGPQKGWLCSPNHTELKTAKAKEMEGEELDKHKKKLQGNIKTYTYHPNPNSVHASERAVVAMQFCYSMELIYDSTWTHVRDIRFFKHIFDHGHSDEEFLSKIMEENLDIARAGSINGIPEAQRSTKMLQQNKVQRGQINDEDMQATASTQYKRITNTTELIKMIRAHAGTEYGSGSQRPMYRDMKNELYNGCEAQPFTPDKVKGGTHRLGPSTLFNFQRYEAATPTDPGVNVSVAGCTDDDGKPRDINDIQQNPNLYYDDEGRFRPPPKVLEMGAFYTCPDINATSLFNLPFPEGVITGDQPADCVLELFWRLHKDTNEKLVAAIAKGRKKNPPRDQFCHHKELVAVLLQDMMTARDSAATRLADAVLQTNMLSTDSLDKSAAEQEALKNSRWYGKRHRDAKGEHLVLEPRQTFMDLSVDIERLFGMIETYNKKERLDIAIRAQQRARTKQRYDQCAAEMQHQEELQAAVKASIEFALRRFETAYASKKQNAHIPAGWKEIAHAGLRDALVQAAAKADDLATRDLGRRVDPKDPNVKKGTANIAFGHGRTATAQDLNGFGHWRAFLMHLFSSGVKVSGADVRVMMECCEIHCHQTSPARLRSHTLLFYTQGFMLSSRKRNST